MHLTKVEFKDGRVEFGNVWSVRPVQGWFTLIVSSDPDKDSEELTIRMSDCKSVITYGERISKNQIADVDMLPIWEKRREQELASMKREDV
jgi:hypothetical protein